MDSSGKETKNVTNFGRTLSFSPRDYYAPKEEFEVMEIVERHAREKIRVVGALHSWSPVVECPDVIVDMKHFDEVKVMMTPEGTVWAKVGAGCRIERLLRELMEQKNATTPTLGIIAHQTIAGAIATGTHGAGRASLSHYVFHLRVVQWNPKSGKAEIREWKRGVGLEAARCHLGCLGIVLSVRLACVPRYLVEENVARYQSIDEILVIEKDYPLTSFFLIPWRWDYVAQRRRRLPDGTKKSWYALLYHMFRFLWIDFLFNLIVKILAVVLRRPGMIRKFYRYLFGMFVIEDKPVVDYVEKILIMKHDLFRHAEMELFVPVTRIGPATEFIKEILQVFSGLENDVCEEVAAMLDQPEMHKEIFELRGTYTHHYPITFRRVLPDDTLISMTSGTNGPWYAISFITFESQLDSFQAFASFLARSMASLFGARPHWGKLCPLSGTEIASLYPELKAFQEVCRNADPAGIFHNKFVREKLGL